MRPGNHNIQAATGLLSLLSLLAALTFSACQPKEITSAKIYIQGDRWDKAQEQLEKAVELDPDNPEAHYLLGQAYARSGRFKDMNREFELSLMVSNKFEKPILAEREKYWIEKYNAGLQSLHAQQYERAEVLLRMAVIIDAERAEAYKKLAQTYLDMNRPRKALVLYRKLLIKRPDDLDLLASTGNLFYSQQQYAEVIPILEKILTLDPHNRDALANMALSYDALGKADEAAAAYRRAIAANPQDKDLIFLFGVFHYKRGHFSEAIQLFEQVVAAHPDDVEATSNIGNSYLSIAEKLRLKLKMAKGDEYSPEEVQKLKDEALQNYADAIPYLEKAVQLNPQQSAQWRNLAVAYISTGQKQKGEEALLKAEDIQVESAK